MYLKSLLSCIKILQVIGLIVCFSMVLSFDLEVIITNNSYSTLRFFVLVSFVAWITCVVIFILNATRFTRNFPIPWHWVNLIFGVVFSLFMLLASALLSSSLTDMGMRTEQYGSNSNMYTQCSYIQKTKSKTSCIIVEISIVIGFVIAILFVAEIVICGHKLRQGESSHDTSMPQHMVDDLTVSTVVAL